MQKLIILLSLLWLSGCITVYEYEGDHKEQYNNISPTVQGDETTSTEDTTPK